MRLMLLSSSLTYVRQDTNVFSERLSGPDYRMSTVEVSGVFQQKIKVRAV